MSQIKSAKRIVSVAITGAIAIASLSAITTAAVLLPAECAHAKRCGECLVDGRKAIHVWEGRVSTCRLCSSNAAFDPGKTIGSPKRSGGSGTRLTANREGIPGGRVPRKGDIRRFV